MCKNLTELDMSIHSSVLEFNTNQLEVIQEDKTGWLRVKRGVLLKAAAVDWLNGGVLDVTLGEESKVVLNVTNESTRVKSPATRLQLPVSPNKSLNESKIFAEVERFALKKLISEAEKNIIEDVKNEFDEKLKAFEEQNQKVLELLERDRAERELETKLREINRQKEEEEAINKIKKSLTSFQFGPNRELPQYQPQTVLTEFKLPSKDNAKVKEESELMKQKEKEKQKKKEIIAQRLKLLESLISVQKEYNAKYLQVLSILKTSKMPLEKEFSTDLESLKKTNEVILYIVDKCKGNGATQSDLDLCIDVSKIIDCVIKKLKEKKAEYEKKEEESKRISDSIKPMEDGNEVIKVLSSTSDESKNLISDRLSDRDKYYEYVSKYLLDTEKSLEAFLKDDKYKSFRRDCLRAVNTPVNAISSTSSAHLLDKLKRLDTLLSGGYNDVAGKTFSASSHPLGIKYVKLLLARKIVTVGEEVVSSHPDTAYAVATVVASLITKYPQFTVLLFGSFYRVCPYLIPKYLTRIQGESDQDYNKRLGFTYNEKGDKEEMDKFLKRMSGVVQMFGALLITPRRRAEFNKPYPLGAAEAWQWITTFITKDPKPDISATLLLDVLEVTGHFMIESYGFSFQKLLYLICTDYISRIEKVTPEGRGGPLQRLKTFLQDVIKVQRISPPKGLLPSNFW